MTFRNFRAEFCRENFSAICPAVLLINPAVLFFVGICSRKFLDYLSGSPKLLKLAAPWRPLADGAVPHESSLRPCTAHGNNALTPIGRVP